MKINWKVKEKQEPGSCRGYQRRFRGEWVRGPRVKGAAWESVWSRGRMKIQGVSRSLLAEGAKKQQKDGGADQRG